MTIPASRAVPKPDICSDGYIALTRVNMSPFITIIKSPRVIKIAGKDSKTIKGLTIVLTKAKKSPDIIITLKLLL
jgi:hypothetical protein